MELSTMMINHYADNDGFRDRMKWYDENDYLTPGEMFAIACANSPDEVLNKDIINECNKHIDRTKFIQQ